MKGNIYPPDADSACYRWKCSARLEQTISTGAHIWEGSHTSVHWKSLSNAQTSCKGFQGSSAGNVMASTQADGFPTAWLVNRHSALSLCLRDYYAHKGRTPC